MTVPRDGNRSLDRARARGGDRASCRGAARRGAARGGPPRWPAVVVWGTLAVAYVVAVRVTGSGPLGVAEALIAVVAEHPLGPLLFAAAYVLRPLLLFSATVLTVAAGHLYGPWLGYLVVLVGAHGGALLAYALARWLSAPWALRALEEAAPGAGSGRWIGWAARLRARTFETVLTLRFLFAPYDAVNFAAGALRLRPMPFLVATVIGSIPGSFTFLLFGASVGDLGALTEGRWPSLDARALAASALLFTTSLLASRWLRRRWAASGGTAQEPLGTVERDRATAPEGAPARPEPTG